MALEDKIIDPNSEFYTGSKTVRLINEAAYHRAHGNMEALLQFGADPNQIAGNCADHYCWQESPLYTAVDARDNRMLLLLLNKKANPNKHFEYSLLPLMRAIGNYDSNNPEDVKTTHEIITTLLQYGASPDEKEETSVYNYKLDHKITVVECFTARELATAYNYTDILALFDSVKKAGNP